MKKLIFILISIFVFRVDAAMVRVVDVRDAHTLVIERNGTRESVPLAGIAIVDEQRATELLRWNVVSTWVMIEPHASGGYLVFRSPDALFVNRELVLRGYARATAYGIEPDRNLAVTYLGTIDPPSTRMPSNATSTSTGRSNGTSRRSTTSRPRQTRSPGGRAASRTSARKR